MEQKANDEFMRNILIEEAWKELSSNFSWSETLLEKYQNRVNWDEISSNNNICWTIPMIAKFSKRINWHTFSENADEDVLTPEVVEAFKDKWDWHELSGNRELQLSYPLLEKYADSWDWEELISRRRWDIFEGKGIDFYEKFREYIPASKLQGSILWDEMVEQQKKSLISDIIS